MNLKESLNARLEAIQKKASDEALLAEAEKTPQPTEASSPEAAETGAASEVITDKNGAEGKVQPGTQSEVGEALATEEGGVDAAIVEPNQEGEAAQALDVKQEKVTKEDIEMVNKAANALKNIGARIAQLPVEDLASSFQKKASALDSEDLLIKRANEGDTTAQFFVDMISSYNYGMWKKANDLQQAAEMGGAQTPEDVAQIEDALNDAAVENPELLMEGTEDEGEELPEEIADDEALEGIDEQALIDASAELEGAAQEMVADVAQTILEEDPSVSEEEALEAAQEVVVDAISTIDAQQAIGATDEDGNYLVDDDAAADAITDMTKTASANVLRGVVVGALNERLGLSPEAFATRVYGNR